MSKRYKSKNHSLAIPAPLRAAAPFLAAVIFFFLICLSSNGSVKGMAVFCILLAVAAVIVRFSRLRDCVTLPLAALALLVLMDGISTFYAVSGKFALNEFLKVLISFCLALALLAFTPGEGAAPGRRIASILERSAALAGLVSIDLLSTRLISTPVLAFLGLFSPDYENLSAVEAGVRMTSLFENPNVFAGCAGIGVLLSLGLAVSSDGEKERMSHVVCLFINALAFILAFSMGATVFIAVAFLVYLLLERKERRSGLFLLMAETLVLTMLATALVSMTSLQAWDGFQPMGLLCAVAGAAALCLLDKYVGRRAAEKLAEHGRVLLIVIAGVLAVLVAGVLLAYNLTGSAALGQGESLRRAAYPEPGEYALSVQADGGISVTVESQNRQDTMMHTSTVLYQGSLYDAFFTVPEDSLVVYFNFHAQEDALLERVTCEGEGGPVSVPLGYKLLPGFIANRVQGLFANQNAIQRLVFFEDGMKLFRRSPVVGLGLGSFENGVMSVQSFFYETKYAHNHYIQALAETGVIGLVLFLGLLGLSAAAVLLARRREDAHTLTPALGAALVFMAGHALTEVVFSHYSYLPFAFGVFALISLCCGRALPAPWLSKKVRSWALAACAVLIAAFFIPLCGNMMASAMLEKNPTFDALEQAARLDMFERNDYLLSYVVSSPGAPDDAEIQAKAAQYAERLGEENSNTIPIYLAEYYLSRGQLEQGFAMVEKYVDYVSSDPDAWAGAFDLLEAYEQDTEEYRSGVARIAGLLEKWNAENIGTVTLDEGAQAFLARMGV